MGFFCFCFFAFLEFAKQGQQCYVALWRECWAWEKCLASWGSGWLTGFPVAEFPMTLGLQLYCLAERLCWRKELWPDEEVWIRGCCWGDRIRNIIGGQQPTEQNRFSWEESASLGQRVTEQLQLSVYSESLGLLFLDPQSFTRLQGLNWDIFGLATSLS